MKKCPKCESEKIEGNLTCPDCGYQNQIEETDQHTNEENESITQSHEDCSEEIFPDSELNDPIEWSELKDLPLESVMEIFGNDGDTEENELSQAETNTDEKEERSIMNINKAPVEEKQAKNQSLEEALDVEQKKRVAELKEFVDHEEENSILAAYIKAHREDTTEEHAKELMKMINDKIAAKEAFSLSQPRESVEDSKVRKSDASEADEEVALSEEHAPTSTMQSTETEKRMAKEVEPVLTGKIKTKEEAPASEQKIVLPAEANKNGESEEEKEVSEKQPDPTTFVSQYGSTDEECVSSSKEQAEPNKNKPKKSKKISYLVLSAVVLLGVGGWVYYDHQQTVQAQIAAKEKAQQQKVTNLKKELASFYFDEDRQFLRSSMFHQDLTKLKAALNDVKEEKEYTTLEKIYEDIQKKRNDTERINALFTSEAIADDHLVDDLQLKTDQEIKRIETDDSAFGQLIEKAQNEAIKQYEQLQTAKEKTKVVYNDSKVLDSVTREQYDEAKKAVEQVKNQNLVTDLTDQLKQVEQKLIEKEQKEAEQKKAEAEKKVAEEKRAAEAAEAARKAQEQAASQQAISSTNQNSANQPIMSTRQSDVADTANSAWNWAPGVQESVINTCIQRGYIISGGYRLEKARIENGEGYYNLYATSTKSALMQGIGESALPFYIVTINCKTGWFGGNGSR